MAYLDRAIDGAAGASRERGAPETSAFGAFALTSFASLLIVATMAAPLTLAFVGALMLTGGMALAAVLWLTGTGSSAKAGLWDVASLLVFLGFSAGIVCGASAFIS